MHFVGTSVYELNDRGGIPPMITHVVDVDLIIVYAVQTDEWCSGPTGLSQIFLDRILQRKFQTYP